MVQKVAVIGAGPCGLSSIKACLDEGLEPTCFESSDDIGGLWRYKEKLVPGRTNIYQCVIINSSKEMMAFSDFPPPAELPNNMHHTEKSKYLLHKQGDFHQIDLKCLSQTKVVGLRRRPDFDVTGQWDVETETADGRRQTHVFDAVMVCTGHYTQPHLPLSHFSGIESFKGRYFHSWEYRNAKGLEGKRVVVIGFGNCGCDIAVDISRVAERVYLSTRSGAWVVGRVGPGGLPFDAAWNSRLVVTLASLFPTWSNWMLERKLNEFFDHKLYVTAKKKKKCFWAQIPVINDDLPGRIISGRIQVKPNVKEFRETSVVFTDGSVDAVVFATGYNYSFPFLPPDLQAKSDYRLRLYKHVIPPTLAHPTLAVVGFIHGLGAINSMAEMQARWATRVFKGRHRNPLQVDVIPYTDSLAEQVGSKPNILQLLFTEPTLALQVVLGPRTSYQYRLSGPGKWAGARQAIFTQKQRITRPFRTRVVSEEPGNEASSILSILLAFIAGAALLCYLIYNWHLPFLPSVAPQL
uniref:Flavin-containing monooxygenase n=1 Tax=Poecilia reticulata TaxID=8081 RepID=A0A3P9MYV3_POERE